MARDHFVAQTYLRRFGDPEKGHLMHGYQKSSLKDFPCRPDDVCWERDGDQNPDFITSRPGLRGDFRSLCEPRWNPSVENLLKGQVGHEDKFLMSAMVATLLACTPTGRRTLGQISDNMARSLLITSHDLEVKAGKKPSLDADIIESLRNGQITMTTVPKFLESVVTGHLLRQAWVTYNQPWLVLFNYTDDPFVTSDNPLAPLHPNKKGGLTRFLPITPKVCLEIPYVNRLTPPEGAEFDLEHAPEGPISFAEIGGQDAREINKLVVQCAEDLVFSTKPSERIQRLVEKYARWGVDHDFVEQPVEGENAVIQGSIMRVRERRALTT